MHPLVVDPKTGFLTHDTPSHFGFDAQKKVAFIQLAKEYFDQHKLWPDLASLCKAVSVHPRTVDNHFAWDKAFKAAWDNIKLPAKWAIESKMYEVAMTPKGYMDRITWLRHAYPEEYNPEYRVNHVTDDSSQKQIIDQFPTAIDAEIVQPSVETQQ